MNKVLVTGATGFLGRHLCKELRRIGFDVWESNSKQNSLLNDADVLDGEIICTLPLRSSGFVRPKFDYIFHLAAVTKAGDYCLHHSGDQWLTNQRINTNILEYWKKYQPQAKMIAMGTSCSYSPGKLMEEENYLWGQPEESLYTYAMTKRMLLIGLQALEKQYGLKWLYFVPSTLFGANFEMSDNHFIFDLIRKIHDGSKYDVPVELWGHGYQKRELVDVEDVCRIMTYDKILALENEIINLTTGIDYTIRDFAYMVSYEYQYDSKKIRYDESKYVGVEQKKLSDKKLKSLVGDEMTPFAFTLWRAIQYYNRKREENG